MQAAKSNALFLGSNPIIDQEKSINGSFCLRNGKAFYKIDHYDRMPPFLMTLVSSSNHWMFLASNGGITAGRRNPEQALFPYYTDDKLIDLAAKTGAITAMHVTRNNQTFLWEPFNQGNIPVYRIDRALYKAVHGNEVQFEETNHDLGLTFTYTWTFSNKYGFVRQSTVRSIQNAPVQITCLDGIQNILPAFVGSDLQNSRSTLVDAYKKNEIDAKTGLGIYSLSARIVDRAEPSEALGANVVWTTCEHADGFLTSNEQLPKFRLGQELEPELESKAIKGAYLFSTSFTLEGEATKIWHTIADVSQSTAQVANLNKALAEGSITETDLIADVNANQKDLERIVGLADGLQLSGNKPLAARHFSNVLFNVMRGGVFKQIDAIYKTDFIHFVKTWNLPLYEDKHHFFEALPPSLSYDDLVERGISNGHPDVVRLCHEFLPLSFSRRHGDPSRPWNYFSIEVVNDNGLDQLSYEGNWRDIFQNWEALAYSFPTFIRGMIAKFLNASTADGYNPYRITDEGIDWEVIEPGDEWSYIGYWGDHQIIYLLKLMEHASEHFPEILTQMLNQKDFVYAQVPYRIRNYKAIKANPYDTIDFDHELSTEIEKRVTVFGADGKLVWRSNQHTLRATLGEKLLVTLLTKLYNFVPGGGIWLNTQRPEWNDANNALVGNGTSLVTLYYIKRFIGFMQHLLAHSPEHTLSLNQPVAALFDHLKAAFNGFTTNSNQASPEAVKQFIDQLGEAGSTYREKIYARDFGVAVQLPVADCKQFLEVAISAIDQTIAQSKRNDKLYHAYNILSITEQEATVDYLYEMLEGQVAVLSSKALKPDEASDLLDALKDSAMYRSDQYSYMLYPNKDLGEFLAKNSLPQSIAETHHIVRSLIATPHNGILQQDEMGTIHFAKKLCNKTHVLHAIDALRSSNKLNISDADAKVLLNLFETTFNHKAFTGRSGTFFGYEGLGSIYWHMVSKLLLAVQENIYWAVEAGASATTIGKLTEHYFEIRAGIGINKSPEAYGAIPTDPYSHTPMHAGAQQPGMTGQVKEDILNRWAELGLRVANGKLHIEPAFFDPNEFIKKAQPFEYVDATGNLQQVEVQAGQLAFTYCGTLFLVQQGNTYSIRINRTDGNVEETQHTYLSAADSRDLFLRKGNIAHIDLTLNQVLKN